MSFPIRHLVDLISLKDLWIPEEKYQKDPFCDFSLHWKRFVQEGSDIADTIFCCADDHEVYASKSVLASRSVVFKNKYFGEFKRDDTPEKIDCTHYSSTVIQYAVLWCFTARTPFSLNAHDFAQLLHFCNYYQLTDLRAQISHDFLRRSRKNPNLLMFHILHRQILDDLDAKFLESFQLLPAHLCIFEEALNCFDVRTLFLYQFRGRLAAENVFKFVISWFIQKYSKPFQISEDNESIILSPTVRDKLVEVSDFFEYEKMTKEFLANIVWQTETLTKPCMLKILATIQPTKKIHQRLTLEEAEAKSVGDLVDHRDSVGRFLPATILHIDSKKQEWKLHYISWNSEFDVVINYKQNLHKLSHAYVLSRLMSHRMGYLRKDDIAFVNAPGLGWVESQIRKFHVDKRTYQIISGQVQVAFKHPESKNKKLHWFPVDNEDEFYWGNGLPWEE